LGAVGVLSVELCMSVPNGGVRGKSHLAKG
jgi:hypothetical protein